MLAFALPLLAASCSAPMAEPPPTVPPTTVAVINEASCYSPDECGGQQMCVDPRYPVCGAQPECEGMTLCGCQCVTACTATSCAKDEVCGSGGCCIPRTCETDAECGVQGTRCLDRQCKRRGTCMLPPP